MQVLTPQPPIASVLPLAYGPVANQTNKVTAASTSPLPKDTDESRILFSPRKEPTENRLNLAPPTEAESKKYGPNVKMVAGVPLQNWVAMGLAGVAMLYQVARGNPLNLKALAKGVQDLPARVLQSTKNIKALPNKIKDIYPQAWGSYNSVLGQQGENIPILPVIKVDLKNKSVTDVIQRSSIFWSYFIQGYFAIKEKRQPYETWIRNALAFYGTNLILGWTKNPNSWFGKTLMSAFVQPKKDFAHIENPAFGKTGLAKIMANVSHQVDKLLNVGRVNWNYLQFCKDAGINLKLLKANGPIEKEVYRSGFWNVLDLNELRLLENYRDRLKIKGTRFGIRPGYLAEAKTIQTFLNRMSGLRYFSCLVMAVWQGLMIGIAMPKAVFWFSKVWDKKFERPVERIVVPADENFASGKKGGH